MKKNFMAIASLLIAAMLLVVSCAPEAKVEDDGLVNASFSVAYGKDVVVNTNPNVKIDYTYSLTPEWNTLENGVEPFGKVENKPLASDKGIGDTFTVESLGRVTPGLWKIEVVGKLHGKDTVVMKGSTKAHFRNANTSKNITGSSSATVYVAPVTTAPNGKLHISIQMEDLGADNANRIKYAIDGDAAASSNYLDRSETASSNVYTYTKTLDNVASGYHFITFTVDGYEGGVTKSFLMLPGTGTGSAATGGNDVKITGSVVPSRFATTGATINVISIPDKAITVESGEKSKKFDGSTSYAPLTVTDLEVTVSIEAHENPTDLPIGIELLAPTYTWYVNGVKNDSFSTESGTITILNEPGDYTITCIISVTYRDAGDAGKTTRNEYTIYGHETQAAVVRLENKVATTTP